MKFRPEDRRHLEALMRRDEERHALEDHAEPVPAQEHAADEPQPEAPAVSEPPAIVEDLVLVRRAVVVDAQQRTMLAATESVVAAQDTVARASVSQTAWSSTVVYDEPEGESAESGLPLKPPRPEL